MSPALFNGESLDLQSKRRISYSTSRLKYYGHLLVKFVTEEFLSLGAWLHVFLRVRFDLGAAHVRKPTPIVLAKRRFGTVDNKGFGIWLLNLTMVWAIVESVRHSLKYRGGWRNLFNHMYSVRHGRLLLHFPEFPYSMPIFLFFDFTITDLNGRSGFDTLFNFAEW